MFLISQVNDHILDIVSDIRNAFRICSDASPKENEKLVRRDPGFNTFLSVKNTLVVFLTLKINLITFVGLKPSKRESVLPM